MNWQGRRISLKSRHGRVSLSIVVAAVACLASVSGAAAGPLDAPSVQAPDLPSVPKPPSLPAAPKPPSAPSAPSLPDVPSVPSSPSVPGVPSQSVPPGSDPGPSGGATGSATPAGPSGDTAGSGARGSGSQGTGRTGSSAASTAGGADGRGGRGGERRAADALIESTVEKLEGCLPTLSTEQRSVATLRAGAYGTRGLSRSRVARRLGASVAKVARIERRALGALRTAGRSTGCGRQAPPATIDVAAMPPLVSNASLQTMPALVDERTLAAVRDANDGSGGDDQDRQEVLGVRARSPDAGLVAQAGIAGSPPEGAGRFPLAVVLLATLVLAAALASGAGLVGRGRHGGDGPALAQGHAIAGPGNLGARAAATPRSTGAAAGPVAVDDPAPRDASSVAPGPPSGTRGPAPRPTAAPGGVHTGSAAGRTPRQLAAPAALAASGIASLLLSRQLRRRVAAAIARRRR